MNNDSDLQVAGDLFEVEHLLHPPREHPGTVAEFAGLARAIAADRDAWEHLVHYDATSRWYHRLRTGPGYEVWLLSWVPGQGSGPHGHGPSAGVLTVLAGELTERTAGAGGTDSAGGTGGTGGGERTGNADGRKLLPGTQRVYPPGYAHEVVNASLEPAVSLHVYYPGLTEMPMRHLHQTGRARQARVTGHAGHTGPGESCESTGAARVPVPEAGGAGAGGSVVPG